MSIRFDGRTVIVTGAGNGLGRSHALGFARLGARVVVNDLGARVNGEGSAPQAAEDVAAEIRANGGEAIADGTDVTDPEGVERMVQRAIAAYGSLDVVVANAGILRDRTFAKMSLDEWKAVLAVHLDGTAHLLRAAWGPMREKGYGRIVVTTSPSGLWGNFGQANYAAAKMALIGLVQTLRLEGEKHDIRVNAVAPTAYTRMTASLFPEGAESVLPPEGVTPAVLFLASEGAPSGAILSAAGGAVAAVRVEATAGVALGPDAGPDDIAARFGKISDFSSAGPIRDAMAETMKMFELAKSAR